MCWISYMIGVSIDPPCSTGALNHSVWFVGGLSDPHASRLDRPKPPDSSALRPHEPYQPPSAYPEYAGHIDRLDSDVGRHRQSLYLNGTLVY